MLSTSKYIYFFRGSLASHVDIYRGWVELARENGLNMRMVTILDIKTYYKQKEKIKHYKKYSYINILITPIPLLIKPIIYVYMIGLSLKYKNIVVHLRKQSPEIFNRLKTLFGNRIKYLIEIEGDLKSEMEYLIKNPYKPYFYDRIINHSKKELEIFAKRLKKADHILVVTENLKILFIDRYSSLDLVNKISVMPTGADANVFFYNEELRQKQRERLNILDRFVFIFIGNVFYSWQNLKRTLNVFKVIKKSNIINNPYIILLIRSQDNKIAKEFINMVDLNENDYLLTSVNHDEVNAYLNASEVGILLRDNHLMNNVVSSGKLGEYLAAGLPVLISKGISNYSELVKSEGFGVVLNNFYDDNEIIRKIPLIINDSNRNERSKWAKSVFSMQAYKDTYISLLKKLAN